VGLFVFADDTTVVCESLHAMRLTIRLIEKFCSDYDVTINAKKTKWMRLTPNYDHIPDSNILQLGGQILENVMSFKFLGVIITADNTSHEHYRKRRSLFFQGIEEINNLGFNKFDVPVKIKTLLFTSLARSKLVYGFETIVMKDSNKLMGTLEANQIKKANNLSFHSKTKVLLYAMRITPIELYIYRRKIKFIIQLTNNEATAELLNFGANSTLTDIFVDLGIDFEIGPDYLDVIRRKCISKLKEIQWAELKLMNQSLVRCIRYLLNNRSAQNDDTIQYLLDPRRYEPG
jgi:hypothetical protein